MLEIYFDGVLLDPDNYIELSQKWDMFDKEFKLGMTPSREINLTVPKSVFTNQEEVVIKYAGNDYAHLIVDKVSYDENGSVPKAKLTLVDKMINANFNYDASQLVPCSIKTILEDICDKMGVELGTTTFTNDGLTVDYYDNTLLARDYLSFISELAGGFARIENDGKLYIKTFNNSNAKPIMTDLCEKIIVGQKHQIKRVVFDNGVLKFETNQDETLETLYLNPSNVFINNKDEFDELVQNILNFTYYNLDTGSTYIMPTTHCGDVLSLTYDGTTYYSIQNTPNLKFLGVWQGSYILNVESKAQAETKVNGLNTQVKAIRIRQNRDENILSLAVEDIKTQKNVINNQLFNQINANTTLIQQTANEITQSVNEITGQLSNDISGVASDLTDATNSLTGLIQQNTTLIQQLATSIISTIRTTGGNNLIRNSVGYSETDFWEVSGTGVVSTKQDDSMSLSGSEFILTGDVVLAQSYNTQAGVSYSVSGKIKHTAMGTPDTIKIEILGQGGNIIEVLNTSEEFTEWHEFSLEEPYIATIQNPTLRITCTNNDVLEITDLIIALGENQSWSGYFDEVYGKEHKLDRNGLRLSNLASNNASKTTSTGIEILQNEEVVAEVSKNRVLSDNCIIKNSSSIGELQTVVLDANNIIEYV